MNLREQHAAIRGTAVEEALLIVARWEGEGVPTVHDLREELGEREGTLAYSELQSMGYLETEVTLAGEADLTPKGRALAQNILAVRRRGGPERNDAVRRGLLHLLAEHPSTGSCSEFVGMPEAEAFGEAFTPEEIDEAAAWLRERHLVKAFDSWQQPHLRPAIEPSGREALYVTDMTIDDYLRSRQSGGIVNDFRNFGNSIKGNVGSIQQGDHNTAMVSQTISDDHRQLVLDKVAELRAMVDSSTSPDLTRQLADIQEEAERPQPVRERLLAKAGIALATALGTSAGQHLVDGLQQLVQMIPG